MDPHSKDFGFRKLLIPDFAAGAALLVLLCWLTALPWLTTFLALVIFSGICLPVQFGWRRIWPGRDFGWANRVTLLRAVFVAFLAALVPFPQLLSGFVWLYAVLSLLVLVLDGVDGGIARATRSTTAFGARFDMELDAFFILVLCGAVLALDKAGYWVLALGLMRYGFLLAGAIWPRLTRALPGSMRRKTVCVWQAATLLVALLPFVSRGFASWALALALVLLIYSFAADTAWLLRHRQSRTESATN